MEPTIEPDSKDAIQKPMEITEPANEEHQQQHQQQQSSLDHQSEPVDSEPPPPPTKQIKPNKVYIGGLPDDTRESDLQDCFGAFGAIKSIELKTGYGFVEFDSRQAAEKAVSVYNDGIFLGNTIRVELSHGGGKSGARVTTEPGACFKCGQHGHWARECPNHSLHFHKRPWIDRQGQGNYHHHRGDSYRDVQSGSSSFSRTRDDYRSVGRSKDDYVPRSRDYGVRESEFRRPPSPTYDYSRNGMVPPVAYNDRRYQPPPSRSGFAMDRPPSPYGTHRSTGPPYDSRDYDRGYDRGAAYYDPRAAPPVPAPYSDRRDTYSALPPPPPPAGYPPQSYASYPPARDHPGRRSPSRAGGRYHSYGSYNGYSRSYERRRSASPPSYREEITSTAGNGYSRPPASYGRSQPYASGPSYGDPANGARAHAPPLPPVGSAPPLPRDYRGYRG